MPLRVRYCSTPAGRVAYATTGSGPPLLCDPGWVTDLRGQLRLWSFGDAVEALAERFTVIRYDRPGCGLSDRSELQLTLDEQVDTVLAVADAVGVDRLSLFGADSGGQVLAAVAARHPDRVAALALYSACARGEELPAILPLDMIVSLVRTHWGRGLREIATSLVNDPTAEELADFAAYQRSSATPEAAAALLENYYRSDVRALLPTVRTRTAVLHREGDSGTRFELGREVAALVPGAAFVPLPGSSHLFYHGDWRAVVDAVLDFLLEPGEDQVRLTRREQEVATLIAEGLTNQAIASRLGVAARTAESHVENIRRKLDVRSRAQIAAWATEHRLGGTPRR